MILHDEACMILPRKALEHMAYFVQHELSEIIDSYFSIPMINYRN